MGFWFSKQPEGESYEELKEKIQKLEGDNLKLEKENKKLEKEKEISERNRVPLDKPWKEVHDDVFSKEEKQGLLTRVLAVEAPQTCKNINVLMLGIISSGKSSLANTFHTVLRNKGQIFNLCAVSGPHTESTTIQLKKMTIQGLQNGTQFNIFDCRGVPPSGPAKKIFEADLIKVINGHIIKEYKFEDSAKIKEDHEKYRKNPTNADKMHCVLFVMKAENIDRDVNDETLRQIQQYLRTNNIPYRVIITAVDKLDLCGTRHLEGVFLSRDVQLKVQAAKSKLDLQKNQILPVANYVDETTQDIIKDVLALQAIENILQEAVAYLDSVL